MTNSCNDKESVFNNRMEPSVPKLNGKNRKTSIFAVLFLFCSIFATSALLFSEPAHAIRVSLKRVVFEDTKRSEIITLINVTGEEQTYRLGWKKFRMDPDKSLRSINEDEPSDDILWAEDMVRFAPRRIKVPAGGSQQIRLLLRRPSGIQDGEYRAHLWIVAEGKPEKFEAFPEGEQKQAIRLAVQPALSLPIFVRHGELSLDSSIVDPKIKNTEEGTTVSFRLNRDGNRSVYGDFDFICTDGGKNLILHQVRGVAVYTEIDHRNLEYTLRTDPQSAKSCKSIKVLYRADPDDPTFKGAVLAEAIASR